MILDPYHSEGISAIWEGPCLENKAHGNGTLTKYNNGTLESTYRGQYQNGIRQGLGVFSHSSGTILECNFIDGQAIGKGKYDLGDGAYYEGDILNYRCHGNGTIRYASGSSFEGFFVSDKLYTGKYTDYTGNTKYYEKGLIVKKIEEKKSDYNPRLGVRLTEYFDKDWKRCSQKQAKYYRLITYESPNRPLGNIKDYYINGQLQSEYTAIYLDYDDEGKNFYEGQAIWFYPNGQIEQKRYYFNNKINGLNSFYYDSGQLSKEVNFDYGVQSGEYRTWYKTGNPWIVASFKDGELVNNKFIEFDESGLGASVHIENFIKNRDVWELSTGGSISNINEKEQVNLSVSNSNASCRFNYIALDQKFDYLIESTIQRKTGKGGEGYGILYGFKDWSNYFLFLISEYGSFAILGKFEGVKLNLCEWTSSEAIKTDNSRNHLQIIKSGDQNVFTINGSIVFTCDANDLRGNNFGIYTSGDGQFVLENLIVKEYVGNEDYPNTTPTENQDGWKGNGSGFFINETGYIATNYHVIESANLIQVEYYHNGNKIIHKAKVVVSDKMNDLAIIKIEDPSFKTLSKIPYVFSTKTEDVGSDVFALGYPMADVMGAEIKFTDGRISAKSGIQGDVRVYQISTPIQPGNSGGPLFDFKGNLIGITSSALNKEYFNTENVNYAIKTSYLKNLIDVLHEEIVVPNFSGIYNIPLKDKIKIISDYVPLIRVK